MSNGNIECTSTIGKVDVSAVLIDYGLSLDNNENSINNVCSNDLSIDNSIYSMTRDRTAEDLYSHQYGLETIKTISNNIIIPLFNGTGTIFPVMVVFHIRDSLREYKSNYVILSSLKFSFYN
jgi:hypothetical protein